MTREQLKSLTLVALFGLCTILVSQIWSGVSITGLKPAKDFLPSAYATEQISDLIYPQSYVVNFGGGSHTAMFSDSYGVWAAAKPEILKMLAENTSEKQITGEEWQEKNRFRSLRFELPVSLGPDLLLQMSGYPGTYSGKISTLDTVLISATEPDALYLGDRASNQYFVLIGATKGIGLEDYIKAIEGGSEAEYETVEEHYRIQAILQPDGVGTELVNTVMVPRFEINPHPILRVKGELQGYSGTEAAQEAVRKLADAAFGNQFAFVNRLMDANGAVVFRYGYGEKAFRVDPSGTMSYEEKPNTALINKKTDLLGSLNHAVSFIGRVGGYPEGLYLSGYKQTDNKLGYRFTFSYPLEGVPVVSSGENLKGNFPVALSPIEIEIQGEQTLYCHRRIGAVEGLLDVTPLWDRVLSLDEIVVKNYEQILPLYIRQSQDTVMDSLIQYRLLQSIRSVRLVYCQNSAGDRMTPAWEIDFAGVRVCFNIYDGRMMAVSP